eukprot:TRINITY_DN12928_c0_g1_i1.p1 TRINITY_DN12928_c0_g1~~TRINITY_DN12928_c0_g1_i1.p1  ORF type:complete len:730 (-),score=76.68 TRINITY_DN12928_c0_g1_i1:68-2257(-)
MDRQLIFWISPLIIILILFLFWFRFTLSPSPSPVLEYTNNSSYSLSQNAVTGKLFQSNIKRKSRLEDVSIRDLLQKLKEKKVEKDRPDLCNIPIIGVVTTLKNGNLCLQQVAKIMFLVVVGDVGSPEDFKIDEVDSHRYIFLSIQEQNLLYPNISTLLPTNHFARKNIGYLHALNLGACHIYDFDDDNYLTSGTQELLKDISLKHRVPPSNLYLTSKENVVNPYLIYGPPNFIWPRGYPLELLRNHDFPILKKSEQGKIDVVQVMQTIDPDVDANWRLENSNYLPMEWSQLSSIETAILKIDPRKWTPFNAQATILTRRIAKFAMLPHTVHGRVSDIWRSFIMQYMMKLFPDTGISSFSGRMVEHKRNSHSYMADRQAELQLVEQSFSFIEYLDLKISTNSFDVPHKVNLEEEFVYFLDDLYTRGFVEKEDVELAILWNQAINDFSVAQYPADFTPLKLSSLSIESDPIVNITAVLHVNWGMRKVVPVWTSIYSHLFQNVRVYVPRSENQCSPISGISLYCVSDDIAGFLSYESVLHSILTIGEVKSVEERKLEMSNSFEIDLPYEGILFVHDDFMIKKSEISGGNTSYQITDMIIDFDPNNNQKWKWGESSYGHRAAFHLMDRVRDQKLPFSRGQSDGYYLAKKDLPKFYQMGMLMLHYNLFVEIAVPTLYQYYLDSKKTKNLMTVFNSKRRSKYQINSQAMCRRNDIAALHPVKMSHSDGLEALFNC